MASVTFKVWRGNKEGGEFMERVQNSGKSAREGRLTEQLFIAEKV